jgi:putative endonuclease
LVERLVRDQEAVGSNPTSPIELPLGRIMFHCYVLRSQKTGRRYVGSCEDLRDRIRRHNSGESKATKHGTPWVLVHSESFATRSEAALRERYFKTGRGRDELDTLS